MSNPVVVFTDSANDLNSELLQKYDIHVVPFVLVLGNDEFLDGVNIDQTKILDFYAETKQLPKTAARNPEIFKEAFQPFIDEGKDIVYVGISTQISLNTVNAGKAAEEMGLTDRIFVIDSCVLSSGIGLTAIKAATMRDEGKNAAEIAKECARLGQFNQTSFMIDTVEFLHKGGRCSGLEMFFASLLRLHPTIRMKGGKMFPAKKYMGNYIRTIDKYVIDTLELYPDYDDARVFITHCAAAPESIEITKNVLKEKAHFKEILVTEAGSTITAHCGRGTLGILYHTTKPIA